MKTEQPKKLKSRIIKPDSGNSLLFPYTIDTSIFLAGSIEMGAAKDWQKEVENHFKDWTVTLFNPRRDSWDSSWTQEQKSEQFNFQVNWELNNLDRVDFIFMYLDPNTKSPISLMELGLFANSGKLIVCCPKGFYRRGNVEIVCTRYNIPIFYDLDEAIGALETKINQRTIIHI